MTSSANPGLLERPASLVRVNGLWVAYAHALFAYSAFFAALAVGCWLHYYKIVQNASYGYPDEWFPSVSAAIGDRYPERSLFQVLIAVTAGPRFLLLALNYMTAAGNRPVLAAIGGICGVLRTFTCGGWVYITSTDDHDWHDIFMIGYIVLTIPWTICTSVASPNGSLVRCGRSWTAITFFATLVPLVYWFIQHKVHVRPGAYSIYAYFEWALIILDVAFDTWSAVDFAELQITVGSEVSVKRVEKARKTEKSNVEKTANPVPVLSDTTFVHFSAHVVNSFALWSVLSALFLAVWYFPLWHMGISGYEAAIVAYFVPHFLLAIPPLKRLFASYPQITRSLTVLLGIGAYKVHEPEHRLLVISVGAACGMLSMASEATVASSSPQKLQQFAVAQVLGLLGTSVFKYMCYSNNPIWPVMHRENGGHNEIGIFVCLVAALFTPSALSSFKEVHKRSSLLWLAIGFSGYFFSIQFLLGDSSTMVMWVWDGYPVTGPTPVTGALIHFAAFAGGIIAATRLDPQTFTSFFYNVLVGGVSAFVLFAFHGWLGYAGACGYTFYLASIAPLVWRSVSGHHPAVFFTLALFFTIVISLASVWIVAYAFVPGGFLLRERTDIILGVSFLMVLAGVWQSSEQEGDKDKKKEARRGSSSCKSVLAYLAVLLSLAVAVTFRRTPGEFVPFNPESQSFTAGIWCVHFGLDNDMWSSETRMLNLLRDAEVDIVGLLETDTQRLIGGNRDFSQTIAHELGMYADYGPGPNKHTWGAVLLSKFPILNSTHHLMPSPVGELAPAIHATLDIYGQHVDVVVFHLGQEEDEEDRRLQSLELARIMGSSDRPMVLLSYLVTEPLVGNYNTYVSETSGMHDIDSTDWDRWCEYILFKKVKKVAYARISRSTITDTELQIAKFKLLSEDERENVDEQLVYGNNFIDESLVLPELRMPQMFRGDGVRDHRYHVFDEPRYFAQTREEMGWREVANDGEEE